MTHYMLCSISSILCNRQRNYTLCVVCGILWNICYISTIIYYVLHNVYCILPIIDYILYIVTLCIVNFPATSYVLHKMYFIYIE